MATETPKQLAYRVWHRFQREGRHREIEPLRDEMMAEARKAMNRDDAKTWVYSELDRLYPPLPPPEPPPTSPTSPPDTPDHTIAGLGAIPEHWGQLPETATLQTDLAWVQSNRLLVVTAPGGASGPPRVDLTHARSPAPSMSALGWLETSIRSYAKYIDVVSRTLAGQTDQQDMVRRERLQIDEIRALLREMRAEK